VEKRYDRKGDLALDKHKIALAGTAFEVCAPCPGSAGKVENDCMKCSRAGATAVPVTPEQARLCDGTKPPSRSARREHSYDFRQFSII